MPKPKQTKNSPPTAAADLDKLLRHLKGVPDRALGVWFRPIIAHLAPGLQGAALPDRVAAVARLAGVPIAPPTAEEN